MEFDLSLRESISALFIATGLVFMLIAGLGMYRMPDLFLRMSMSTKASTLGIGFVMLGALSYFIDDMAIVPRVVAIIIFVFITSPISAHMLGRAGYRDKDMYLWEQTKPDELKVYYTRYDRRH